MMYGAALCLTTPSSMARAGVGAAISCLSQHHRQTRNHHGREQSARRGGGGGWGTRVERTADNRDISWDAWRRKSDAAQDLRTGAGGLRAPNGGGHPGALGGDAESLPPGGRGAGGAHGGGGAAHGEGEPGGYQAAPAAAGHDPGQQGEGGGRVEDKVQDTVSTGSSGDVTGTGGPDTTSIASMSLDS